MDVECSTTTSLVACGAWRGVRCVGTGAADLRVDLLTRGQFPKLVVRYQLLPGSIPEDPTKVHNVAVQVRRLSVKHQAARLRNTEHGVGGRHRTKLGATNSMHAGAQATWLSEL